MIKIAITHYIKTHDSESGCQEKAAITGPLSELFTCSNTEHSETCKRSRQVAIKATYH